MQPVANTSSDLAEQLTVVLSAWKLKPGTWQLVDRVPAQLGTAALPVVEIAGRRYVVRRQPEGLTENDTRFRHAFMRHLAEAKLPVPSLLPRPDGTTYGVVEDGIYEVQGWLDGQPYLSDGPAGDARLAAAAATLGELHYASAQFQWQPHRWPADRSPLGLAQAYCRLIHEAAERESLPETVRVGLERVARTAEECVDQAAQAMEVTPGPPELHIHGDYQPHNLAFGVRGVAAIYDFDAARWWRRVDELAYSLLYFAGARWDNTTPVTPPLVDDGLDVLRANAFLSAYGRVAPPAPEEARLLADALALAFPIVFANGLAEDLVFAQDYEGAVNPADALARLQWADTFWPWLDRFREALAQAWEG